MNIKLAKIFRGLMAFGKVETDNGILIYEGDVLAEGTEVFIEDENGNIVPAPDGQYGDYKVVDGKIAPSDPEPEAEAPATEEPVEQAEEEVPADPEPESEPEPESDNTEERIAALEAKVAELEAKIAEIVSAKEDMEFSSMKPAEKEIKDVASKAKSKGALKYFDK